MLPSCVARRASRFLHTRVLSKRLWLLSILALALFSFNDRRVQTSSAQTVANLVGVSAASFALNVPVAPNSIVAAFTGGVLPPNTFTVAADAIPGTPDLDLPTLLNNISVEVHGRSAGIFALSNLGGFDQLNILVPPDLEPGKGPIVVRNAAGQIVAAGEIEVAPVTPGIFTANANGSGAPAALYYRYRNGVLIGVENAFRFSQESNQFVPRPIDLGPPEDEVFLVLFMTGIRGVAQAQSTRVLIGGEELVPLFVGAQGGFAGLDQVNIKLSRTLRGRLTLIFAAIGFGTSNLCEIEVAPPSNSPPSIVALSKPEVLAGEMLEVTGTGFSSDSEVVISDSNSKLFNAKIVEARATSLRVLVPYGAGTGNLVVRNVRGEASFPFKMRTSMSGIVQTAQVQQNGTTLRVGVPRVTIRLIGINLPPIQTNADGSFLMPDVPPTNPLSSGMVFEVDGTTNGVIALQKERRRIRVITSGRDNPFPEYIELKPEGTQTVPTVAPGVLGHGEFATAAQAHPSENESTGQTGTVVFEPNGSTVQFPDGQTVNALKVTVLDTGRTPSDLPFGRYSSTIVQLTPVGARIQPGGRLTFPNTDALPPNKVISLYRFDQTPNSNTIGQFVNHGSATVSADGMRILTQQNAVTESTYYFVSDAYPTTTVYGKVVEEDNTAARGALVQVRGQSIFSLTDQNGSFYLLNVPIVGAGLLAVEVSFLRPDGTVDRAERTGLQPSTGGLTYVSPPIVLPGQGLSKAPLIVAPKNLSIEAGKTSDFSFLAYARVAGLSLQPIGVSGAPFASVLSLGNDRYILRLSPGGGAAGNYVITLTATDSQNVSSTATVDVEVKAPSQSLPVANAQSVITNEDTPVNVALTGTGGSAFRIVNQPVRGRLEGTAPNVTYRPDANFNGSDTFSFALGNGSVESAPAIVSIAVQPVPDSPQLGVANAFSTNIGQRLTFVISGSDGDAGQTLTLTQTGLPAGATVTKTTATSWLFDWTPTAAQIGAFTVNLTLADNGTPVRTATAAVVITVDAKWARSPGIDGGLIQTLLVTPGSVFAGTDFGGVFRSNDNGATWAPSGLAGRDIQSFLLVGGALYAATDEGVFRSTDNGSTWTEVSTGLPEVSPNNYRAAISFAVSGNTIYVGTTAGIYKTTNSGANWTDSSVGLPPSGTALPPPVPVYSIVFSGSTMFCGTSKGIYRSTDNGANWSAVNTGYPGGTTLSFAVNGSTIFAAAYGGGVYSSSNNGASWSPVNNGLTDPFVRSLLVSGGMLFAGTDSSGVFTSSNNGATWTERGPLGQVAFTIAPGAGGTILIGTFSNVFRSPDNGVNWTRSSSGLANLWIYSVVVLGNSIFTGTDDGVYRSTDNGASWVRVGLQAQIVATVAVAGQSILASSGGLTYRSIDNGASWTDISEEFDFRDLGGVVPSGGAHLSAAGGILRSTDGGAMWSEFGTGLPKFLDGTPKDLDTIALNGNSVFVGTFDAGIYRSNDNGATWSLSSNGLPHETDVYEPVRVIAANNNVLYSGTLGSGMFRSLDNGATWTAADNGIPIEHISSIAFSGNAVFAGVPQDGVFRSTDNGQTWKPHGLENLLDVFAMAGSTNSIIAGTTEGPFVLTEAALAWVESSTGLANRFINAAVYDTNAFIVGTYNGGIYRSTDDGKNWQPSNSGLPPAANVKTLVKNPAGTFAGIPGSGIYFSSDQGQNWVARNNNLANNQVNILAADATAIYAGTEGGVFRSTDGGQNWTQINSGLTRLRVLSLTAGAAGIFAGTDLGLFRFNTQSSTWSAVNIGLTDLYIVSLGTAPNGSTLLAGTTVGLFTSTDQGQNWTKVNRGISESVVPLVFTNAGTKVLAGTVNGFYLSDDNGMSWVVNNTGLVNPQVSALATKGNLAVAGTRNAGAFTSQIPDVISNHPPAITFSCPNMVTTAIGNAINCTISRSDPDAGQTTVLSAGGLLAGASFNPATGAFSWTPTAQHPGVHTINFTATDNGNPRLATHRELYVTVNSPVPQITGLNPNSRGAGGTGIFNVTVNGSGFVANSRGRWNGSNRTTTFLSSTLLLVRILASDLATPGTATITVVNPAPGGGVSNGMTFTITAPCNYSINPTSQAFGSGGAASSVNVTAGTGCGWTAVSNNPSFITIVNGSPGSGNGTVNYFVTANPGTTTRQGSMTIAGQTFSITQSPAPAGTPVELVVDDSSFEQTLGVGGGAGGTLGVLNRLTPGNHPATLTGISIFFPAGEGVTVGEQFTLLFGSIASGQADSISPTLQTLTATVQTVGSFAVYPVPNLAINSGDFVVGFRMAHAASEGPAANDRNSGSKRRSYYSGNGNAPFTLIDTFTTPTNLSGNLLIRAQANVGCTSTISSTSQSFTANGGPSNVNITNSAGCNWSAFSNVNWVNITSAATGSGNATVNFSVVTNLSTSARSGTLTIAGRTFTVNQSAGTGELLLDDTSFEDSVGVPSGGVTFSVVNRFTPPVYPLTITGISVLINNTIPFGRALTLIRGTVPSGATNLDSVTFQEIGTTVQTPGSFHIYTIPNMTVNSGDIVLGYRIPNNANEFPAPIDKTTPRQRSFFSTGGNFQPIGSVAGLDGNFAIRARVMPPAGVDEEPQLLTSAMPPAGRMTAESVKATGVSNGSNGIKLTDEIVGTDVRRPVGRGRREDRERVRQPIPGRER